MPVEVREHRQRDRDFWISTARLNRRQKEILWNLKVAAAEAKGDYRALADKNPEGQSAALYRKLSAALNAFTYEFYGYRLIDPPLNPKPFNTLAEAHCRIPPKGWYCTRAFEHEGPCAAVPTLWTRIKLFFKDWDDVATF